MTYLGLFLLAVYGATFLVCDAEIFAAPRRLICQVSFFRRMLTCHFCTGIWVAAAIVLCGQGPGSFRTTAAWLHVLAGAASSYFLDRLSLAIEIYIASNTKTPPPSTD